MNKRAVGNVPRVRRSMMPGSLSSVALSPDLASSSWIYNRYYCLGLEDMYGVDEVTELLATASAPIVAFEWLALILAGFQPHRYQVGGHRYWVGGHGC